MYARGNIKFDDVSLALKPEEFTQLVTTLKLLALHGREAMTPIAGYDIEQANEDAYFAAGRYTPAISS